jgi:hypothetical protein
MQMLMLAAEACARNRLEYRHGSGDKGNRAIDQSGHSHLAHRIAHAELSS